MLDKVKALLEEVKSAVSSSDPTVQAIHAKIAKFDKAISEREAAIAKYNQEIPEYREEKAKLETSKELLDHQELLKIQTTLSTLVGNE